MDVLDDRRVHLNDVVQPLDGDMSCRRECEAWAGLTSAMTVVAGCDCGLGDVDGNTKAADSVVVGWSHLHERHVNRRK